MNITTWILVTLCCDINIGILAYIWLFEIKKRTSKVDSHRQSVDLENPHQGSSNTKELDRNDNSDNRHENSKSCFTGLVSTLKGKVALIIVLSLIYMLEIKDTIPTKTLERDTTGPLILIMVQLLIIGLVTTRMVSKNQQYKFLNRDQSDEWKGLMQVFIILAHYFRLYSYCAARVSVACYVWMTGYGQFMYFQTKKNYTKTRVLQTYFRIWFLVVIVCLFTGDPFMRYYVIVLHSFFYLILVIFMFTKPEWNDRRSFMTIKFVILFVILSLVFENAQITEFIFDRQPFRFFLIHKNSMREWISRTRRDRWATAAGMLAAHNFNRISNFLLRTTGDTTKKKNKNNNKTIISTEDLDSSTKNLFKLKNEFLSLELFLLLLFSGALLLYWVFWCARRYEPEEFASYMDSHCYSSLLFIAGYLLLRNLTPTLRSYYMFLFQWIGQRSLEFYILQWHVLLNKYTPATLQFFPDNLYINFYFNFLVLGLTAQCAFYAHNELSFFLFSSGDRFQYLVSFVTLASCGIFSYFLLSFFPLIVD